MELGNMQPSQQICSNASTGRSFRFRIQQAEFPNLSRDECTAWLEIRQQHSVNGKASSHAFARIEASSVLFHIESTLEFLAFVVTCFL